MNKSLSDWGIVINHNEEPQETRILVKRDIPWNEAVQLAIQCRKTHPEEPIAILPMDAERYTVVRCVR
jgi:hypothetical protein